MALRSTEFARKSKPNLHWPPAIPAFVLAAYNRGRPLIIDPTVTFTTFLAGSNADQINGGAVDSSENAYVTGTTRSMDYPTVGPIQMYQGKQDVFVTKLSSTGTILFSTYLGGSNDDLGNGIAVDSTGVYVTGTTFSTNFPVHTFLGPAPALNVGKVFVTKLTLNGDRILYSARLGGSFNDQAQAIAVDSMGRAWVVGNTYSRDFP